MSPVVPVLFDAGQEYGELRSALTSVAVRMWSSVWWLFSTMFFLFDTILRKVFSICYEWYGYGRVNEWVIHEIICCNHDAIISARMTFTQQ